MTRHPHLHRAAARLLLAAAALLPALAAAPAIAQSVAPAAFVVNNAGDSITSYTLNPDGTLNRIGIFATGDLPQALSLSPDGKILAVGHGTSASTPEELRFYGVNADATLTPLLTTTTPDSPLDMLWLNNDVLAVTRTVIGPSEVYAYAFDRSSNLMTTRDIISTGTFTSGIAVAGNTLYADAGFLSGGSLSAWSFDASGDLEFVETEAIGGGGVSVDYAATPDGRFLYAAGGIGGNEDELHAFGIAPSGALTPLSGTPFLLDGRAPAEVIVDENGERLYVSFNWRNAGTGIIRAYEIDPATGAITDTGDVFVLGGGVGDRGDTGPLAILGDVLFNLDMSTFRDGVLGLQTIRINPDGSMSHIDLLDTGTALGNVSDLAVWGGMPIPEPGSAMALAALGTIGLLRRRRA